MHLPQELLPIIYEYADLETCLALRAVDSRWKTTLDQLDAPLVAQKVLARVPWMRPGETGTGLVTWADCARVLIHRKKSATWQKVTVMDDIVVYDTPSTTVASIDTRQLPDDFHGIFDGLSTWAHQTTKDRYEEFNLENHMFINTKTLTARKFRSPIHLEYPRLQRPKLVRKEHGQHIYSCFGVEVATPPDKECISFRVNDTEVLVRSHDGTLQVIPLGQQQQQRQPLQYTDGFPLSQIVYTMLAKATLTTALKDNSWHTRLVDAVNKREIVLASVSSSSSVPNLMGTMVVDYDGILWHAYKENLIPIFVDLDDVYEDTPELWRTPDVFSRPDWAIKGPFHSSLLQGPADRGFERYICCDVAPTVIADLASHRAIRIDHADDEDVLFPGISKGKLGVWKWTPDTVAWASNQCRLQMMLHPEKTEIDLSHEHAIEDDFDYV